LPRPSSQKRNESTECPPIEVLNHALAGLTEEMLVSLVRGAHSPNIKERKDCSTALFDHQGRVIAQAQAIPVHLGALGDLAPVSNMAQGHGKNKRYTKLST
jgi:N-methylhydantoinase B